jgi:S-formylglutathione hydrolase FrmB
VRDRLYELEFSTPDLPAIDTVRILLPPGYDTSGDRYPTLYLLHGCCNGANPGGARNWTDTGNAEKLTVSSGAIAVMPDGGAGGMYADWADGSRKYESFIIGQLLPWVDLHLRTIPRRESRGVAGLSMGGYGATYFAAHRPDLFSSVGTFSGIVDLLDPPGESSAFVEILASQEPNADPEGVYGDRVTAAINWHAHNPADLAVNFRSLVGVLQEYGDPPTDPIEGTAKLENEALTRALKVVHVDPTVITLPLQGHSYTVWNDGLANYLKIAVPSWHGRVPVPDGFDYTAVTKDFSAFNYRVHLERPVTEFATLGDVTQNGLHIAGSGRATITTAPRYEPGAAYRIAGASESAVTADADGRLVLHIDLGPSATTEEFAPDDAGPRPAKGVPVTITATSVPPPSPPASGACVSRRSVTIHPRGLERRRLRKVTVYVSGKRVAARRVGRRAVHVTLQGRPKGIVHVRIVAAADGRNIVDRRTYRLCISRATT